MLKFTKPAAPPAATVPAAAAVELAAESAAAIATAVEAEGGPKAGQAFFLRAERKADGGPFVLAVEDPPAAVPHAAELAEAQAEGAAKGAADERARIQAILGSDAAKKRPRAAASLALAPSALTPETATATLASLPEEGKGGLGDRMAEEAPNPGVGPGGAPGGNGSADAAAAILAAAQAAGLPMPGRS